MSCFISDWGKNRDLLCTIKNTSGSTKVVFPQTKLYKDDTLLMICFNPYWVLANNQQVTISLDSILRFDGCAFYHMNCQYLFDYGRLRDGIYHFVEELYDTSGNKLTSTDSTTFRVDGNQSAGPRYPYNNAIIYRDSLPKIWFMWFPVWPNPPAVVKYNLIIKELKPFQTVEHAWDSNLAIVNANFINQTKWKFDSVAYYTLFTSGKRYIWRIVSYNYSNGHWVGNNYGRSELYELEISSDYHKKEPLEYQKDTRCLPVDFDDKQYLGWEQDTFYNQTIPTGPDSRVVNYSEFYINPLPQKDPYGNFISHKGTYSAKFNNDAPTGRGFRLKFLYSIDSSHSLFNMSYALVLEDPYNHTIPQKPYYSYKLYRGRDYSDWDYIDYKIKYASINDPFFTGSYPGSIVLYRDWNCYRRDMSKRIGQSIRVVLSVTDCQPSGHFGYAYADFCNNNLAVPHIYGKSEFCIGEPIILFGDSSENEDSYRLRIEESDSLGNADSTTTLFVNRSGSKADTLNINDEFADQNFKAKCNQYYKITLIVSNECTDFTSISKVIKVTCPGQGLAGRDYCCEDIPIILGSAPLSNMLYSWTPMDHLNSYTNSYATFLSDSSVHFPKTYYLTVYNQTNTCSSVDTVTIYCSPPSCSINSSILSCYGNWLSVSCPAEDYSSIKWTFRDNGNAGNDTVYAYWDNVFYNPQNATAWAILEVTNACGTDKDSILIYRINGPDIDTLLISADAVDPTSAWVKNRRIYFWDTDASTFTTGHAYNDYYKFRIQILDRWGGILDMGTQEFTRPSGVGFINGDIYWDSKPFSEEFPDGVYKINIQYKKCSNSDPWENFSSKKKQGFKQLENKCATKVRKWLWGFIPYWESSGCVPTWQKKSVWEPEITVIHL